MSTTIEGGELVVTAISIERKLVVVPVSELVEMTDDQSKQSWTLYETEPFGVLPNFKPSGKPFGYVPILACSFKRHVTHVDGVLVAINGQPVPAKEPTSHKDCPLLGQDHDLCEDDHYFPADPWEEDGAGERQCYACGGAYPDHLTGHCEWEHVQGGGNAED